MKKSPQGLFFFVRDKKEVPTVRDFTLESAERELRCRMIT